ncbi:aldehyde dehydrogenase family protein [Paraburkholderia sp. LEh10]|uniref:aldehyde dehydrogenase family protein n=1 Tax=Paraburkholderia sp. LEh10 TaxID=2821353 RepID=UPI001AE15341|nr:aldehyde dehydrogenase family protein [Paraburkholderia sp. LEh10]MBP0596197.1 aldehyde dehydrogenase family protein [Paraburkholderia sp. LEh10]
MGALVSEEHTQKVLSYIETGMKEADLLAGGRRVLLESGGCFIEPTIFYGARPNSKIMCDEIFGPVLSVSSFEDESEGVRLVNDTIYGLGASIWTDQLSQAHRVSRLLKVGSVSVNTVDHVDVRTPFGGCKQSGNARDLSLRSIEKYTDVKTTWIAL